MVDEYERDAAERQRVAIDSLEYEQLNQPRRARTNANETATKTGSGTAVAAVAGLIALVLGLG